MKPLLWRLPLGGLAIVELLGAFDVIALQPVYTDVGLLLITVIVWLIVELTRTLLLPKQVIILAVVNTYLDALGDYLHWYDTVPYYDMYLHLLGTGAATAFLWFWLRTWKPNVTTKIIFFLAVTGAISGGVLYEIEEYLEDVLTGSHRLGDGPDTASDLLMNTLGAVIIGIVLYWRRHRR